MCRFEPVCGTGKGNKYQKYDSCSVCSAFRANLRADEGGTQNAGTHSPLLLFFFLKVEQEEQTQEMPAVARFSRVPLTGTKRHNRNIH
jgi:hypothetical protein